MLQGDPVKRPNRSPLPRGSIHLLFAFSDSRLTPAAEPFSLKTEVRMPTNTFHSLATFSAVLALALPSTVVTSQDSQAAQAPQGCTLRIHVNGLRNSVGVVGTTIFNSPAGWPEDNNRSFRHGPTAIEAGQRQATAVWDNLPPGDYGVAAIHDENKNHKLDRNRIGWPKEGFGFANNPHVGLSAPGFKEALVHVTCPVTETTIHLQYK